MLELTCAQVVTLALLILVAAGESFVEGHSRVMEVGPTSVALMFVGTLVVRQILFGRR